MMWCSVIASVMGMLITLANAELDLSSFNSIDANDDGKISQRELKQTGLPPCLNDMVELAYLDDSVDTDDDDLLSAEEWYNFFSSRLGRLVTVSEVVDWIIHSVQKPKYANVFRENSVSGLDFIDLVRNGGKLLEDELGITGTGKKNILRKMILVLCTDSSLPRVPLSLETSERFHGIDVSWKAGDTSQSDSVRYQLQRAESGGKFVDLDLKEEVSTNYLDSDIKPGIIYSYRVQAWTEYGRSGWSGVTDHTTNGQQPWGWSALQSKWGAYLPGGRGLATAFVVVLCWFIPAVATINRRSSNVSASSMESMDLPTPQEPKAKKAFAKPVKSKKVQPDVGTGDDAPAAEGDTAAEGADSSKILLGASVEEGDGELTLRWLAPVECRAICKAKEGDVLLNYEWSTSPLVITGLTNGRKHSIKLRAMGQDGAKYSSYARADLVPHRKKSYVEHMVDGLRWTP